MLEACTTLGFLAASTSRVRLGTMVAAVTFRAPALLLKAVRTLDVLSGGRAWLGIGAGYQQDEATAMGLDLPPVAGRFERLEETLQVARQMWADDPAPFRGRHYRLDRPVNRPRPARRGGPPVLIGGAGERRTLRLVSQYADACNLFDVPDIRHKLDVLRRHCDDARRDAAAIEKTVSTRWESGRPVADVQRRSDELGRLGIDHLVLIRATPWTVDDVESLAAVAS